MSGVLKNTQNFFYLDSNFLNKIKSEYRNSEKKISRLLLHNSSKDNVQEMIICFGKDTKIYPNCSKGKSESLNVLEGKMKLINFIIEVILVMLGIGILFHFGNPSSTKFRFVNAGTIITSLVILLASSGLSIYFNNFNYYNKVYGSIGSLLIALVWLNIVSYVIIIGFELYAKIDEIKNKFIKS